MRARYLRYYVLDVGYHQTKSPSAPLFRKNNRRKENKRKSKITGKKKKKKKYMFRKEFAVTSNVGECQNFLIKWLLIGQFES